MSELDNIKSARQQYRAAFMSMATSRDKYNLYKTGIRKFLWVGA